jgi:hypothetical protein
VGHAHHGGPDEAAQEPAHDTGDERTIRMTLLDDYMTGPMIQGANSSSPTPESSLLLRLPEATATISSKI